MAIKSAGITFVREYMDHDPGDPFGSTMGALSDLCEAWYLATGECLPEFRPGTGLSINYGERQGILTLAIQDGVVSEEDVSYWYTVLDRLDRMIRAAGRNY